MRRIHTLLLLCAALLGVSTATWAHWRPNGNYLTELTDGAKFFIKGEWKNGTTGDYLDVPRWTGVQYPQVTEQPKLVVQCISSDVNDGFAFELTYVDSVRTITYATGEVVEDLQGFVLKNLSTDKYLGRVSAQSSSNKKTQVGLVDTYDQAIVFFTAPATTKEANVNAPAEAFILMAFDEADTDAIIYNDNVDADGTTYTPMLATWNDGGTCWTAFIEAEECDEEAALINDLVMLYQLVESYYPLTGGDIPGLYPDELAQAFNEAYVACNIDDILSSPDYDVQMLRDAKARFEPLVTQVLSGPIQIEDGAIYYIFSSYSGWVDSGLEFDVYLSASTKNPAWGTPERTSGYHMWRFHKKGDYQYTIENIQTQLYFGAMSSNNTQVKATADTTVVWVLGALGDGQFNIKNNTFCLHPKDWAKGNGGVMYVYGGGKDSQSAWHFEAVPTELSDSVIAGLQRIHEADEVNASLVKYINNVRTKTLAAFEYDDTYADDHTPHNTDAYNSNAGMSVEHGYSWGNDGAGFAALFDDDLTTHFHTTWTGNITSTSYDNAGNPTGLPTAKHNLSIELDEPISEVAFRFNPRSSNYHNNLTKVDIEVSMDGENWTAAFYGYDFYTTPGVTYPGVNKSDMPYIVGPVSLGGSYQYLRISNYSNDRQSGCFFNASELRVLTGVTYTEGCQAATCDQAVVSKFLQAYSDANKYYLDYTADDIEAMQTAQENLERAFADFLAEFVDPAELKAIIAKAKILLQNFNTGDGQVGTYDAEADCTDLENAVAAGERMLEEGGYTEDEMNDIIETISDAIAELNSHITTISPDKWYKFQYASAEEYMEYNFTDGSDNVDRVMVVAKATNANAEPTYFDDINEVCFNKSSMYLCHANLDSIPGGDSDLYSFRFIPYGDEADTYIIQNKATGLFVSVAGRSNRGYLVINPTCFQYNDATGGFSLLRSLNLYTGKSVGDPDYENVTLHFCNPAQSNEIRGWNDFTLGTKSSIKIIETGEEVDEDEIGYAHYNFGTEGSAAPLCFNMPVTEIDGATPYDVVGKFVDAEEVTCIGMTEKETVEAGEPAVFVADAAIAALRFGTDFVNEPVNSSSLHGVLQKSTVEDAYLTLSNTENGPVWHMLESTTATASANVAYITTEVPEITLEEFEELDDTYALPTDIVTAIASLQAAEGVQPTAVFNLAGQRVNRMTRGLYITGGRKVLVK